MAGGLDEETIRAVLSEAGKFAGGVLEPLNWRGDQAGCRLERGKVETPPGWTEAYQQFTAGGWSALPCPPEFGGQGLPSIVAMPVCEIWNAANMAFGMCPLLTNGAIDSLYIGGSDALKASYLPRMISGEWTGTMNLTEPQAGRISMRCHARRAGHRRHIPHQRHEDLHQLWRSRTDAQHHPSGSGSAAGCAGRHARHLAVPGAEVPGQSGRNPGSAQRRRLCRSRKQARHPR